MVLHSWINSLRHEKPDEEKGDLAHQNIKDRYYGVNDPVAKKMLAGQEAPKEPEKEPVIDPRLHLDD